MEDIIHAWEILGFVNVRKGTKDTIKHILRERYGSCLKACQILKLPQKMVYGFLSKNTSFTRSAKFFTLIDALGISREKGETWIKEFKDYGRRRKGYRVDFPFMYTPLVLRSVAHIPGDGYVGRSGQVRWIQNEPEFMVLLLKKLLKRSQRPSKCQITVPMFLVKVNCSKLRIGPRELRSWRFIDAVMKLPRRYRVQALLALIVDEGNIDVKGNISIRMKERNLVEAYAKLCDSLGYDRCSLTKITNNSTFGRSFLWKFRIRADGIRELHKDYMDALATFGRVGGLWNKDQKFMERCQTALNEKAIKDIEGRKITKEILKLLSEHGALNAREIRGLLGLYSYDRIYEKIKYLKGRGVLKRVDYGKYDLAQNF